MPTVQYIHNGEIFTKQMITPKQITKVEKWYKEARKALPQIPEAQVGLFMDREWMITWYETNPKWVKFDLENRIGEKAYIVILRSPSC